MRTSRQSIDSVEQNRLRAVAGAGDSRREELERQLDEVARNGIPS